MRLIDDWNIELERSTVLHTEWAERLPTLPTKILLAGHHDALLGVWGRRPHLVIHILLAGKLLVDNGQIRRLGHLQSIAFFKRATVQYQIIVLLRLYLWKAPLCVSCSLLSSCRILHRMVKGSTVQKNMAFLPRRALVESVPVCALPLSVQYDPQTASPWLPHPCNFLVPAPFSPPSTLRLCNL